MHTRTRQFILETLLTTRELSRLISVPEITLKKRYERDNRLAVLKGNNLLWDRRDFEEHRFEEHRDTNREIVETNL